ncbi:MAG: hypothetical protein AAGE01_17015 [Pseudomonadota bacterium]
MLDRPLQWDERDQLGAQDLTPVPERCRIEILVLEGTGPQLLDGYGVGRQARYWKSRGHRVRIQRGPRADGPRADVCLVHVDLSRVPAAYGAYARRCPLALNSHVLDIRRRRYSSLLVAPESRWPGPVIIKTDANSGGIPEAAYLGRRPPLANYRIVDTLDAVPAEVWRADDLVVERFLPEADRGFYHVRSLQCFGRRLECLRFRSRHPLVKFSADRQAVEPHPDILAWRARLAVDFGKLDYVELDGQAILLDVNKTTGAGGEDETAAERERHRYRAAGLFDYFDGLEPYPAPSSSASRADS